MSKSFKYVSDFEFPSDCGFSGSAGKTMVKGYARGGYAEGGKTKRVKNVIRNEREELNRVEDRKTNLGKEISRVRSEMRYDKNELKGMEKPSRKQYPVAPSEPMIAMKKGGSMSKSQAKIGKVMGEYKAGELHSGSKSGPVVKNRKQAVAIAMSEAKKAK